MQLLSSLYLIYILVVKGNASLLRRGDCATFLTFPQILVCHPRVDVRCELGSQIHKADDVLMDDRGLRVDCILAIPPEAIYGTFVACTFDYETNGVRKSNGVVRGVSWKQEERAFLDWNISKVVTINDFKNHISFPLVKKFLRFVDVIVGPFVRATDQHDDEIPFVMQGLITNRRLEEVTVLLKPLWNIDWW